MTDQTLAQEMVADENHVETPATEESSEAVVSEPVAESNDAVTQGEDEQTITEPKEQPKPRAQKRIEQLAGRVKEQEIQLQQQREQRQGLPWEQPSLPQDEVTAEELQTYIDKTVEKRLAMKDAEHAQIDMVRDWSQDLSDTLKEHPELDSKSEQYDPDIDSAFQDILEETGVITTDGRLQNPNVKVSKIVAKMKKVFDKERTKGASATTASMAKAMSESAVTPNTYEKETLSAGAKRKKALESGDTDSALDAILFGG